MSIHSDKPTETRVTRSDADLLYARDPDAFGAFYTRHVAGLTAYIGRRTRRPELLFDLVGETFARALARRGNFDPRHGPAAAWLFGIARTLMTDAERHREVTDATRHRFSMAPIALDDAELARVGEAGRVDLVSALAELPESQRIVVLRRVLGEDDYPPALPAAIEISPQVTRPPELHGLAARRGRPEQDPFAVLRERLVVAAGGQPPRRSRRALVLSLSALGLVVVAVAAALTLGGGDDPKPKPTPTPTATPTGPPPISTATAAPRTVQPAPTQGPRQASPGRTTPPGTTPSPTNLSVELTPDLAAGKAGWCVAVALDPTATSGVAGRDCTPSGPPDTPLIATGAALGPARLMYAVVDRRAATLVVSDGRSIAPRRDPALPPAWRVAIFPTRGRALSFSLLDASGSSISMTAPSSRGRLITRKISPNHPPHARCAIRAHSGSHLQGVSARLLTHFETLDVVRPSYLSCARTVFRRNGVRFEAAVLLNARDLLAPAPPLPVAPRELSARRAGAGLLVVLGGTEAQREHVLKQLSVVKP